MSILVAELVGCDANAQVYLSGPMTGLPEWNFPAFEAAASALRALGLTVLSPHEKDLADGFDPSGDGAGFDLRAALEWDVAAVLDSDAVVLLPGWEDSPGCAVEVLTAKSLGIPVLRLADVVADPAAA